MNTIPVANHIVIEGIDGCGKGTLLRSILEDAKKNPSDYKGAVFSDASPYDKEANTYIRSLLKKDDGRTLLSNDVRNKVLLKAFISDHMLHANDIEKRLSPDSNEIIISDRYFLSTLAYQSLSVDFENIWNEIEPTNIRMPQLVLFLDIDPQESINRINKRGEAKEVFEKLETLNKVKQNYEKAFARIESYFKNSSVKPEIARLNANLSPAEVFAQAKEAILKI